MNAMRDAEESSTLLVKNVRLFREGKLVEANVLCKAAILEISRQEIREAFDEKLEGRGRLALLPGVIDAHVHFRSAGTPDSKWDYKEDFASGGAAAAAGGVTTVIDMPNCIPPTTTAQALKAKLAAARRDCPVNYFAHFGVESDGKSVNASEVEKAKNDFVGLKVFMGSSTGSLLVQGAALEKAFELAAKLDKLVLIHAELEELVNKFKEEAQRKGVTEHNKVRPPKCAVEATRVVLRLASKTRARLHICHLNCADEATLVKEARKRGASVSCEATPHHLFLSERDAERLKNFGKTNPPLRSEGDRAALFHAFASGAIDCAASDHAPHSRAEKEKDYWSAPSGVPGVETMLPLLLNAVNERKLSLERVVNAACASPAKIFGFKNKGRIERGFDADLTLTNLHLEKKIRGEDLHSKCGWTPFEGVRVRGWPVATIVGGKTVFEIESF